MRTTSRDLEAAAGQLHDRTKFNIPPEVIIILFPSTPPDHFDNIYNIRALVLAALLVA